MLGYGEASTQATARKNCRCRDQTCYGRLKVAEDPAENRKHPQQHSPHESCLARSPEYGPGIAEGWSHVGVLKSVWRQCSWPGAVLKVVEMPTNQQNTASTHNSTALVKAALQGHLNMVLALLKAGAMLEALSQFGGNALCQRPLESGRDSGRRLVAVQTCLSGDEKLIPLMSSVCCRRLAPTRTLLTASALRCTSQSL